MGVLIPSPPCTCAGVQVSCATLSESDTQEFALIANGEFIETNDVPDNPDPDDWLDILDSAGDIEITTELVVFVVLGLVLCCTVMCLCRTCREQCHKRSREQRHRDRVAGRKNTTQTTMLGRKVRPRRERPQPCAGPIRQSTGLNPARYPEAYRRGPMGVSASSRSIGSSQRSGRLTGAGAAAPIVEGITDTTAPSTPPQEACPECGLLLADVVQLVDHVQVQHGGRARRQTNAAAGGAGKMAGKGVPLEEGKAPEPAGAAGARSAREAGWTSSTPALSRAASTATTVAAAAPAGKSFPARDAPPPSYREAGNALEQKKGPTAREDGRRSESPPLPSEAKSGPPRRHKEGGSLPTAARARGAPGTVTDRLGDPQGQKKSGAIALTGAAGSGRGEKSSPPESAPSSPGVGQSGRSGGSSGASTVVARVPTLRASPLDSSNSSAEGAPSLRASGASSASTASNPSSSAADPSSERPATRLRDLRPNPTTSSAAPGGTVATITLAYPIPASIPGSSTRPSANGGAAVTETADEAPPPPAMKPDSGSGARGGASAGANGAAGGSDERRAGAGGGSGRQSRGRTSVLSSSRGSHGTRSSSLDRVSLLPSSRGLSSDVLGSQPPPAQGRSEAAAVPSSNERILPAPGRFRRNYSNEELIPTVRRSTEDPLQSVASVVAMSVPTPVFSPVGTPGIPSLEPAYSPVDRARAEERDAWEDRPSNRRKFFRQLSR